MTNTNIATIVMVSILPVTLLIHIRILSLCSIWPYYYVFSCRVGGCYVRYVSYFGVERVLGHLFWVERQHAGGREGSFAGTAPGGVHQGVRPAVWGALPACHCRVKFRALDHGQTEQSTLSHMPHIASC